MAQVNLDTAQRLDIICRKGDTFKLEIDFGQNIPGAGWAMQVRESDTSSNIVLSETEFTYVVGPGFDNNGDPLNSSKLTIEVASSEMETVDSGVWVYDLENNFSGVVKTYLYGIFKINEDVTVV
jgi:hypothetical protein